MNRIMDSRPQVTSPYVTSDFPENAWGQLSLSHYNIEIVEGTLRGVLIDGIYLASQPGLARMNLEVLSFRAWAEAQDKALDSIGALYLELADEEIVLAEMGLKDYGALLKKTDEE